MSNPETYPSIIQRVINVRKEQAQRDFAMLEGARLTPAFYEKVTTFFRRHYPEPNREGGIGSYGEIYSLLCKAPIEIGDLQVAINTTPFIFKLKDKDEWVGYHKFTIDVLELDAILNLDSGTGVLESKARARIGDFIIGGPPPPPKWSKPLSAHDINDYIELLDSLERLETTFSVHSFNFNINRGYHSFLSPF